MADNNDDLGDEEEILAVITVSLSHIEGQGYQRGLRAALQEIRTLQGYAADRDDFHPDLSDVEQLLEQKLAAAVAAAELDSRFEDAITLPTTQFMNSDPSLN